MVKLIDLTGQRFGFWIVLGLGSKNKNNQTQWLCRCECSNQKEVTSNSLRTGNSTSCGCNHNPNLIGTVFGDLTVVSQNLSLDAKNKRYWNCKCSCGNTYIADTYKLRSNLTTSCGCKIIEKTKKLVSQNIAIQEKTAKLIKEQIDIIASFNKEIAKSIALIDSLKANVN
jgi:hypothetical protein